jgi:hypothetical protein
LVGIKPTLVVGMSLLTIGLLLFTEVPVGGSYWVDLLPGFLVLGVAIPLAFVPITIAALAGTKPQEAGLCVRRTMSYASSATARLDEIADRYGEETQGA